MESSENQDFIKQKKKKIQYQFFFVLVAFIGIVLASLWIHIQMDWTQDKRYSITNTSKEILKDLNEEVYIEVFLSGKEMPAAFKKLSKSAALLLRQCRIISNNKITYEFIDPLAEDKNAENALSKLNKFGLSGIPVTIDGGKKGSMQKMLFPWAIVHIKGKDGTIDSKPIFLQETNTPNLSRAILNKSEILLEFNFINAIHELQNKEKKSVAYLRGNGQSFNYENISLFKELGKRFHVDSLNLQANIEIPSNYDLVFVQNPIDSFSEIDKFKLDQYLMKGGNIVWAIDGATGTLDSLMATGSFNSMPLNLNLSDLFFHYGFRINQDLILDALDQVLIPLASEGFENAEPVMYPWVYNPVLTANSEHMIGKQMDAILTQMISSIDINDSDPSITKTPILQSSKYSKTQSVPAPILLESAMEKINEKQYNKGSQIGGLLLEGRWTSFYAKRQPLEVQEFIEQNNLKLKRSADKEGKMIVFSDGQIFYNLYSEQAGPSEMGTFRYLDYQFDNKILLQNIIAYLNGDEKILKAKNKDFSVRLLDPQIVKEKRKVMQWLNIAIPILVYIIIAGLWFFLRRKKYFLK